MKDLVRRLICWMSHSITQGLTIGEKRLRTIHIFFNLIFLSDMLRDFQC